MKRPFSELPPRATLGGYVYIIEFSNGTVKVGMTATPIKRLKTHESTAASFGIQINDWWVSPARRTFRSDEAQLISMAAALGGTRAHQEYFHGIDFNRLVERAGNAFPEVPVAETDSDDGSEAIHTLRSVAASTRLPLRLLKEEWRVGALKVFSRDGDCWVSPAEVTALIERYTVPAWSERVP